MERARTAFVFVVFVLVEIKCHPIHSANNTGDAALLTLSIPVIHDMSFLVSDSSQQHQTRAEHNLKPFQKSVIYIIASDQKKADLEDTGERAPQMDPWALAWYVTSFMALVVLFLFISFTECLCSRRRVQLISRAEQPTGDSTAPKADDVPPPPYDLFGPPSYDSLFRGDKRKNNAINVFTVPITH